MKRGAKGTPDAVKAQRGNPGKRKLVDAPPPAAAATPAPAIASPSFLDKDPVAKAVWARFVADYLPGLPFIKPSDAQALARWCYTMAQWTDVTSRLKHKDIAYETESKHGKMLRLHPLFLAQGRLEERLLKIEDRMGLNPMARQALIKGVFAQGFIPEGTGAQAPKREDEGDAEELPLDPPSPATPSPVGLLALTKH
jgi:P27 family predicted phage terminase small subunit